MTLLTSRDGLWTARELAAGAAAPAAGLVLGALFAVSAWMMSPALLPGGLAFAALLTAALARPEVGVAAALLLPLLANVGLDAVYPELGVLVVAGVVAFVALVRGARPALAPPARPLAFTAAALLGASVAASANAIDLPRATFVLRLMVVGLVVFLAVAMTVRRREQLQWVLGAAAGAAAGVGALALYEHLSGNTPDVGFVTSAGDVVGRASGGFVHPNRLGGFLVLVLPLAVAGAMLHRRHRMLYLVAVALGVLGVYVSFSRGALAALAVIPFLFLRGRHVLVAIPLVAVVAAVAAPSQLQERFATETLAGGDVATRVDIWTAAAAIGVEQPVLGVGPGGFPRAYAEVRLPGKQFLPDTNLEPPPHAHNLELHLLAEQGVVGLGLAVALLAVAIGQAVRLRRSGDRDLQVLGSAILAALVAFLLHSQFEFPFFDEPTTVFFWGLLGLVAALSSAPAHGEFR